MVIRLDCNIGVVPVLCKKGANQDAGKCRNMMQIYTNEAEISEKVSAGSTQPATTTFLF